MHGCHSVTQARLDDERLFVFSPYYRRGVSHPSGVLVLCNESKGLYIRQDRLNAGVDYPATLPHALAVKIMWSPGGPRLYVRCSEARAERRRATGSAL